MSVIDENDRRGRIIDFIKSNSMCTKAQVIRFMDNNGSSVMTTHDIIKDLESEKIIQVLKDKPNSQTHHLILNDDNELNRIDHMLTEIEKTIDGMELFIPRLRQLVQRSGKKRMQIFKQLVNLESDVEPFFTDAIFRMLQIMMVRVSKVILSQKDSQVLYNKIIKMMLRIDKFNSRLRVAVGYNIHRINVASSINNKQVRQFSKNNDLDVDLINQLIQNEREFDKNFVYDT